MLGSESSYYPQFWELAVMALTSVELVVAGVIIKQHWGRENEPLPIPVALALWASVGALYFVMTSVFYTTTAPERIPVVLAYSIVFFVLLVVYFTLVLRNAIAVHTVERIGPFSAKIDDPSEFAAARKLALRGDIDGAVARYRAYPDNQANALFEAARLLKSEDRFTDAAAIYQEVAEHSYGRRRVWAEAIYHLGKLYEVSMNQPDQALALYKQILDRSPESRFGQFAGADYIRLLALRGGAAGDSGEGVPAGDAPSPDPFYRRRSKEAVEEADPESATSSVAETESPPPGADIPEAAATNSEEPEIVPVQDPFYRARMEARAAALASRDEAETPVAVTPRSRKPATSKKSAKAPPPRKTAPKRKPRA